MYKYALLGETAGRNSHGPGVVDGYEAAKLANWRRPKARSFVVSEAGMSARQLRSICPSVVLFTRTKRPKRLTGSLSSNGKKISQEKEAAVPDWHPSDLRSIWRLLQQILKGEPVERTNFYLAIRCSLHAMGVHNLASTKRTFVKKDRTKGDFECMDN